MIVSNNTLLNILLPNENKALKEVLKEADTKSLGSNKSVNVQDILKNLVKDIKSESKSNETITNILKNSTIFKDLGSFPKELNSLLKNLPNDTKLDHLKTTIQSFLVNIKDLDENNLKDLVQKSGIFLESKISKNATNPNIQKLNEILTQIKALIKNDSSPKAKELNNLIDKIITQNNNSDNKNVKNQQTLNSDLKTAINLLKNLSSNTQNPSTTKIVNLTNQLENISTTIKLGQSKIDNNILPPNEKNVISSEIKSSLLNLKTELQNSKNPLFTPIIKQMDNLIQKNDIFSKTQNQIEPKSLIQSLIQSPKLSQIAQEFPKVNDLVKQLQTAVQNIEKLESNISKNQTSPLKVQEVSTQIKQTINQLQNLLSEVKNGEVKNSEVKSVDIKNLTQITEKLSNISNLFSKVETPESLKQPVSTQNIASRSQVEVKSLIQSLIQSPKLNQIAQEFPKVNDLVKQLQTAVQNIEKLESNILKNQTSPLKAQEVSTQIKQTVNQLQTILTEVKTSEVKSLDIKNLTQITEKLSNSSNVFSKVDVQESLKQGNLGLDNLKLPATNLQENIKSIITAIKSSILQLQTQSSSPENLNQFEVQKSVTKLENIFQSKFDNIQNQLQQSAKAPNDFLQNDIKSTLLKMQDEFANNPKFQELNKSIDKLLTHIDYYQLLSVTSSSNYLYLPFIWDMLDEGSISMKKLEEERYFCEIHLTLKELGNMDLLLGLYDKNSLDITIFSNKDFVKDMIKENLSQLKVGLNKIGLVAQKINILDLKDPEEIKDEPTAVYSNPYEANELGFGVNIKV